MQKKINLNKEDMSVIVEAANKRTAANKNAGNHNNPDHKFMVAKDKDHFHSEVVGLTGEIAVAKWLGVEIPTLVFDQKYFKENKHKIKDVGQYEVKSTEYATGKLILQEKHVNDEKNLHTKYILCTVKLQDDLEGAIVIIRGWATPFDMTARGSLVESQYNESWRMSQELLNSMNTLRGLNA
jgi:hypothetical protein